MGEEVSSGVAMNRAAMNRARKSMHESAADRVCDCAICVRDSVSLPRRSQSCLVNARREEQLRDSFSLRSFCIMRLSVCTLLFRMHGANMLDLPVRVS